MARNSVISLDPIDAKRKKGFIGRLLVTTWHGGKKVNKTLPFGHYMFCGPQRKGKTASVVWYMEHLAKKYKKSGWKIKVYSNFGIGKKFNKQTLFKMIDELDPYVKEIRIFLVDEIHTYWSKDGGVTKEDKKQVAALNTVFSQLGKRNVFVLSTAQIYGRLDKSLREQCLYMVNCRVSLNGNLINEFIPQEDIICDELGRWAGNPRFIKRHGLAKNSYDTKLLIRE